MFKQRRFIGAGESIPLRNLIGLFKKMPGCSLRCLRQVEKGSINGFTNALVRVHALYGIINGNGGNGCAPVDDCLQAGEDQSLADQRPGAVVDKNDLNVCGHGIKGRLDGLLPGCPAGGENDLFPLSGPQVTGEQGLHVWVLVSGNRYDKGVNFRTSEKGFDGSYQYRFTLKLEKLLGGC